MKRLDKLLIVSFLGPFFVTLSVVIFIFLMKVLIFYINDFVSKDISLQELARLFTLFALNTIPVALPLAILLSSLMTYGNLGEFFELTAIKSAGISMIRAMRPLFLLALLISIFSFFFNDRISPWVNLRAYSLLYDIKTTKAALKIKDGIFYNDLPGFKIKVDKKLSDGKTMLGMVIYRHDSLSYANRGNLQVILADSGRMFTTTDKAYLILELFDGNEYHNINSTTRRRPNFQRVNLAGNSYGESQFMKTSFKQYKLMVSLSSFGLKKGDESKFKFHEYMRNIDELNYSADSILSDNISIRKNLKPSSDQYFTYSSTRTQSIAPSKLANNRNWVDSLLKIPLSDSLKRDIFKTAIASANNMTSFAKSNARLLESNKMAANKYLLEVQYKYTNAVSCLILFIIGASLGAIIKKGGFGVPVLISLIFYILLYVLTRQAKTAVEADLVPVPVGAWAPNAILLMVGLYMANLAQNDSRLFDVDVYVDILSKFRHKFSSLRKA